MTDNAESIRRLRSEAKAAGRCYECRKRPSRGNGVVRCQTCLDANSRRKKKYRRARREAGVCTLCAGPIETTDTVPKP